MSQHLVCSVCATRYDLEEPAWRCACGGVLDVASSVRFHKEHVDATAQGLWRYAHALPVADPKRVVSFGEGMTPLVPWSTWRSQVPASGSDRGVGWAAPTAGNGHQPHAAAEGKQADRGVWLKLDYVMPTGSFKDRGATVLVSKVKELGVTRIVEDSSGNAGAAIAAYAAAAGIGCEIYVPARASGAKPTQIKAYGVKVVKVRGPRENAARKALEAAEACYYASHAWNPFFIEGVKTIAFEICEQLGGRLGPRQEAPTCWGTSPNKFGPPERADLGWRAPDAVVTPVGNGTLLLGLHKGFGELLAAGVIRHRPKLIGVQSEACAPLHKAFVSGSAQIPDVEKGASVADGIAVAKPVRGRQIVDAVRKSGGHFVTVTDGEVGEALRELCRAGFYVEPTAAAGWAGLKQCDGLQGRQVVVVLTGSGLKSPTQVQKLLKASAQG
ncbi:MAG: pyridoxal-phosphate dependent enzyme [Planctomycetes bacterium]|nr:pyridoxal-phosphate dependent enzyme [Planctomycetota bacterium]